MCARFDIFVFVLKMSGAMYFQFGSTKWIHYLETRWYRLEFLCNKHIKSLATNMDGVIHFNIMSGSVRKPHCNTLADYRQSSLDQLEIFRFIIHPIEYSSKLRHQRYYWFDDVSYPHSGNSGTVLSHVINHFIANNKTCQYTRPELAVRPENRPSPKGK